MGSRGTLIVFEGISGSGKSSTIEKVYHALEAEEYDIAQYKWNECKVIKKFEAFLRSRKKSYPRFYSLAEWLGFIWSYRHLIKPQLVKGKVVMCDRYVYTGVMRDKTNHVNTGLGRRILRKVHKPAVVIYLEETTQVCFLRIKDRNKRLYYTNRELRQKNKSDAWKDKQYLALCKKAYEECFKEAEIDKETCLIRVSAVSDINALCHEIRCKIEDGEKVTG